MSADIIITRAGPLTSIQDEGRFGMLRHGISASGPMDGAAFAAAGGAINAGRGGVEFTSAGIEISVTSGSCRMALAGGEFTARRNGQALGWPCAARLETGDVLSVMPGRSGNYGYLRFGGDIDVPSVMGSVSTSSRAGLGGLDGRVLRAGDRLKVLGDVDGPLDEPVLPLRDDGAIRVVWGLHADLFPQALREKFVATPFGVSSQMDRMGVRLKDAGGVFTDATILSLASDAIVPGDIQILGDGTPIVLMRDHQPTGGYPRIATIISADLDRFAQLRPGTAVSFQPVTVDHAHQLLRSRP